MVVVVGNGSFEHLVIDSNYELANIAKEKGTRRASSGKTILGFKPDLYKNFNKGYTDFFFNGRKKDTAKIIARFAAIGYTF